MMTTQILKFVDFTKTQKPKYLQNKLFFLQIKKSLITQVLIMAKSNSVVEVTFKAFRDYSRKQGHACNF